MKHKISRILLITVFVTTLLFSCINVSAYISKMEYKYLLKYIDSLEKEGGKEKQIDDLWDYIASHGLATGDEATYDEASMEEATFDESLYVGSCCPENFLDKYRDRDTAKVASTVTAYASVDDCSGSGSDGDDITGLLILGGIMISAGAVVFSLRRKES